MQKNKKIFRNTIFAIIKHIKSSATLFKAFFNKTKNRKFKFNDLFTCIMKLLKNGVSFREAPYNFKYNDISWTTIYKFYRKLVRYNVIQDTYNKIIKTYLSKSKNKTFLTDTTLIVNKMGRDYTGYNPQLLKHKTSKISFITSNNGVPIDVFVTAGNHYDSKILLEQLNNPNTNLNKIKTNDNELLGDAGYDSEKIRNKLHELKFGKLICNRNKRNIRDPNKLIKIKLTDIDKIKLKKRHKVENIFSYLKSFKRVSLRYDKFMYNYSNFVLLASLMITIKKTSRDTQY